MKRFATLCRRLIISVVPLVIFLLPDSPLTAQRQFPYEFVLDSRSTDTLVSPSATSARHRYRITAWGTYSMWEDTVNSSVDPVWIYSFPDEEWAKPEWRIFSGYPIYVGDPLMLNSHGLRVNNSPFPKTDINMVDHRYSMIINGTGQPITTTIVDWNFKDFVKRDAHENNSGYLHVLVEELPLTEIELCTVDSSAFPIIRVAMRVMRDSVTYEGLENGLRIYEDGVEVTIDSVDCNERSKPVSVGLVFDRSGSMNEVWGNSTRMIEVKKAGQKFIDRLAATDEGAVYSFSSSVTLDQTWTSDKSLLRNAVNQLAPQGYTAMNDAVDRAITDVAIRPSGYKQAVVVLSDGEDNVSRIEAISTVIAHARSLNIPVFAIGLLLDNDDSLRALAVGTGGAYFSVTDPDAIDSVFNSIAELLFEKGCCNVWYTTPRRQGDGSLRHVEADVEFPDDTTVSVSDQYRAPEGVSGVQSAVRVSSMISVVPNPTSDRALVDVVASASGKGTLNLYTMAGERVYNDGDIWLEQGRNIIPIDVSELEAGRYVVEFRFAGEDLVRVLEVLR